MKLPRRALISLLLACLIVSIACVAYPIYVIRPFRAQGATELVAALAVMRIRTLITLVSAIASLACLILYWRAQSRKWFRAAAAIATLAVFAMAFLARVNVYEIMFHPIDRATFTPVAEVNLDKDEKVIAVKIGSMARAYPIRGLSYHHIANDMVDKTAIVATY